MYSARTHGEPAEVIEDLPGFIIANVVCNGVWLATGAHTYDWWPKWVLLGTGIALVVALVHAVFGIEEVRIGRSVGHVLITVLTLGAVSPIRVSWRCCRPPSQSGTLN